MENKEQIVQRTIEDERERFRRLACMVDEVCALIINEECPEIDIVLARQKARDLCCELFPDDLPLFDMIYGSRFKRLDEQFRHCSSE